MSDVQPTSKEKVLPKTELEWIAHALNDAAVALPVLFTMLAKIGAREGAMVADEILGHVKCAQKQCGHLVEAERRAAHEPELRQLIAAQAEDDGLWFNAVTAGEAYLQQELRKLHAAIEGERIEFKRTSPPPPAALPESVAEVCRDKLVGDLIEHANFFEDKWLLSGVEGTLRAAAREIRNLRAKLRVGECSTATKGGE